MKCRFYLFLVLLLSSCQTEEVIENPGEPVEYLQRGEVQLSQTGEFSVPCTFTNVDDLRDLGVYTDNKGREVFYLCDDAAGAKEVKIYFFDWQTKEPIDTIVLPNEGPIQISEGARIYDLGVTVIAQQLLIWDAFVGKFYQYSLENTEAPPQVFNWPKSKDLFYKPIISCVSPLLSGNRGQYMAAIGFGVYIQLGENDSDSLIPAIIQFNLDEAQQMVNVVEQSIAFPDLYYKGFYGVMPYSYMPSFVVNEEEELLVSFPLDPGIYAVSLNDGVETVKNVKSTAIDDKPIKPLRSKAWLDKAANGGNIEPISLRERKLYTGNLDTYKSLLHLPEKEIYLRLVCINPERKSTKFNPKTHVHEKISVMILDKELNVLNEHFIEYPENSYYALFIKENKIYFLDDSESEEDEDRLYFNEFSLVGL